MTAAGNPDPKAAARASSRSNQDRRAHATIAESEDFAKGARCGAAPSSRRRRPGLDWGALARRRAARQRPAFEAYHAGAIPKLAALVGSRAARRVEGLARVPHAQPAWQRPAAAIRDASFAFSAPRCRARRSSARATSWRSTRHQRRAPGRGRQGLCRQIFPGVANKAAIQGMVDNIKAAFAKRVSGSLTGWRRRPRPKR
jgi:putative endopeptidase